MDQVFVKRTVLVFVTAFLAVIFILPYQALVGDSGYGTAKILRIGERTLTQGEVDQRSQQLQTVLELERPLARVNDVWTTQQEFIQRRSNNNDFSHRERVYNHLALLHLARQSGIAVSRQELEARVQELYSHMGGSEQLKERLRDKKLTEKQFLRVLGEVLTVRRLLSFAAEFHLMPDLKAAYDVLRKRRRAADIRWVKITRGKRPATAADREKALASFFAKQSDRFVQPAATLFEVVWTDRSVLRKAASDPSKDELLAYVTENREDLLARLGYPADPKKDDGDKKDADKKDADKKDADKKDAGKKDADKKDADKKDADKKDADKKDADKKDAGKKDADKKAGDAEKDGDEDDAEGKKTPPTNAELVAKDRDRLLPHYVAATAKAKGDAIWAAVGKALESGAVSLRALARQHEGLSFKRSPGMLEGQDIDGFIAGADAGFSKLVEGTQVGESTKVTEGKEGTRYLARILDRRERVEPKLEDVARERVLEVAYELFTERQVKELMSEATYQVEIVHAGPGSWGRPPQVSSLEIKSFYEDNKERLYKDKELADVRLEIETLLSTGRIEADIEDAVDELRSEALKHDPEQKPNKPEFRLSDGPLSEEEVLESFDLKAAAAKAGLAYDRVVISASDLSGSHALLGDGKQDVLHLQLKKPGHVSAVQQDGRRRYMLRLLSTVKGEALPFAEVRDKVLDKLVTEEVRKPSFLEHAKAIREQLVAGNFSEIARKLAAEGKVELGFASGVRSAGDLHQLPTIDRGTIMTALSGGGTDPLEEGAVTQPLTPTMNDGVAYIVELIARRLPADGDIKAFEVEQQAEKAMVDGYVNQVRKIWFHPQWHVLSGYKGAQVLLDPDRTEEGAASSQNRDNR